MEITFVLTDIKEIDADFANFLFENGFDDCTPYSSEGRSFLSLEAENPEARLRQLADLGIKAEIFELKETKEEK
jgi:hypothetical protein